MHFSMLQTSLVLCFGKQHEWYPITKPYSSLSMHKWGREQDFKFNYTPQHSDFYIWLQYSLAVLKRSLNHAINKSHYDHHSTHQSSSKSIPLSSIIITHVSSFDLHHQSVYSNVVSTAAPPPLHLTIITNLIILTTAGLSLPKWLPFFAGWKQGHKKMQSFLSQIKQQWVSPSSHCQPRLCSFIW